MSKLFVSLIGNNPRSCEALAEPWQGDAKVAVVAGRNIVKKALSADQPIVIIPNPGPRTLQALGTIDGHVLVDVFDFTVPAVWGPAPLREVARSESAHYTLDMEPELPSQAHLGLAEIVETHAAMHNIYFGELETTAA